MPLHRCYKFAHPLIIKLTCFCIILLKEVKMKYNKEQRLPIGREIYRHTIMISQAANKYGINPYTARAYMREYRDINGPEPMSDGSKEFEIIKKEKVSKYEDLKEMTKDQLIDEVIKARVGEERAKKVT